MGQTGAKLEGVKGVSAGDRDKQPSGRVDRPVKKSREAVMSGISRRFSGASGAPGSRPGTLWICFLIQDTHRLLLHFPDEDLEA